MFKVRTAFLIPALLLANAPAMATEPTVDTPSVAPADPARLAAARQTVDYVFPPGTYARVMNGTMDRIMDTMMDSMVRMPVKSFAGMTGLDTSKLGSGTLAEIMQIYDPAYKQRMQITTRTMMGDMIGMMTQFEPDIREGLAQAYAAKFEAKQLAEMNAFFATPTGKAYAADSYVIMMSPQVMERMQAFMPKMMQQMPAMVEKVKAATANLPAPRKYSELSEAEKGQLARLLGISRTDLDKRETKGAAPAE